jgi:hypothetical protein
VASASRALNKAVKKCGAVATVYANDEAGLGGDAAAKVGGEASRTKRARFEAKGSRSGAPGRSPSRCGGPWAKWRARSPRGRATRRSGPRS